MDPSAYFITILISLFAVIDPLGAVPIFLIITPDKTPRARVAIALKSAAAVCVVLTLFALFGHLVLTYFGISPQAFEIAGGLILIKLAYDLLWARLSEIRFTAREEEEGLLRSDVSVIPMAMPLLSGPGAIATVVVLSHTAEQLWMNYFPGRRHPGKQPAGFIDPQPVDPPGPDTQRNRRGSPDPDHGPDPDGRGSSVRYFGDCQDIEMIVQWDSSLCPARVGRTKALYWSAHLMREFFKF